MARPTVNGSRGLGFWGMVSLVMVALKLKEHVDEYHAVPSEEDGLGPVALRSPAPGLDGEEMGLSGDGFVDTEIPGAKVRRAKRDCCVCCGLRCGLFWKAFGIVCAVLFVWQAIKLVFWAVKPTPTGLEGMPEFSTSIGCANAKFFYNSGQTTVSVPVGAQNDHGFDVLGAAIGTLTVVQGSSDATEVKYDVTVRTDDQSLLQSVNVRYPTPEDLEDGMSSSRLTVSTPAVVPSSSCMRYDVTLYIPPNLKTMHLQAHSAAQIKFDTESNFDLDALSVMMYSLDDKTMLLPHSGVHADALTLELTRGWLVGDAALVGKTTLTTQRGDAALNVHVHPTASTAAPPRAAELQTTTGSGRSDVFYENHPGHPHRRIESTHRSSRNGDLYLHYKNAEFVGTVDLKAKSMSASGLQDAFKHGADGMPWVGDKNGADTLVVNSPSGWVGLYF